MGGGAAGGSEAQEGLGPAPLLMVVARFLKFSCLHEQEPAAA